MYQDSSYYVPSRSAFYSASSPLRTPPATQIVAQSLPQTQYVSVPAPVQTQYVQAPVQTQNIPQFISTSRVIPTASQVVPVTTQVVQAPPQVVQVQAPPMVPVQTPSRMVPTAQIVPMTPTVLGQTTVLSEPQVSRVYQSTAVVTEPAMVTIEFADGHKEVRKLSPALVKALADS